MSWRNMSLKFERTSTTRHIDRKNFNDKNFNDEYVLEEYVVEVLSITCSCVLSITSSCSFHHILFRSICLCLCLCVYVFSHQENSRFPKKSVFPPGFPLHRLIHLSVDIHTLYGSWADVRIEMLKVNVVNVQLHVDSHTSI